MPQINAFVGHSFSDDDSVFVGKFLKYFDALGAVLDFSWIDAAPARPTGVASKVHELFAEKNVFIAICSRREYTIEPRHLSQEESDERKSGHSRDFQWKTSDWLTQEIGFALGKGIDLIVLLEEGVRPPGGIQGDMEYIPFSREKPELAFEKIVQMLSTVAPATPETTSETAPPPVPKEPSSGSFLTIPKPEWDYVDYEMAIFISLIDKDPDRYNEIDSAYKKTDRSDEVLQEWNAFTEYAKLRFGTQGSLSKLESMASPESDNPSILHHLALGYLVFDRHEKAARTFERASKASAEIARTLSFLGSAGANFEKADLKQDVSRILNEIHFLSAGNSSVEGEALRAIKQIAEAQNDNQLSVALLERLVEMDPSDTDARFSLAYAHSNLHQPELALLHYLRIPENMRSTTAWNNLGVAYGELWIKAKGVNAMQRSADDGGTLAMANLARKLAAAGFVSQARGLCNQGRTFDQYDAAIDECLANLSEIAEEEDEKEKEATAKAAPIASFLARFARGLTDQHEPNLAGDWVGPLCPILLQLEDGQIKGSGEYEGSPTTIPGLLGAGMKLRQTARLSIAARITGRSAYGDVSREGTGGGLLLSNDTTKKIFLLANEDHIEVLEAGYSPELYVLRRAEAEESNKERSPSS